MKRSQNTKWYPLAAIAAAALVGAMAVGRQAAAGPKQVIGQTVPAAQRLPIEQIDHALWDALLKKYVDHQGYVNYRAWHASQPDREILTRYLRRLSQADPQQPSSAKARLAFWANAYNAVTAEGILRLYPTTSIRNHTAKLIGYNIWKDLVLVVGAGEYSLDQIEHKILRPMKEPRIHFAIVCASVGCPRLLNEAYTPAKLESQLTANTRHFFADRGKFRADPQQGHLELSPILKWFASDFGADRASQLKTIAPYLPTDAAQQIAGSGRTTVSYLPYDWSLNDQARLAPSEANRQLLPQ